MKKILLIAPPVFIIAAFFMYRLAAENRDLNERVASLQARMTQQLDQVEQSSRQRLDLQKELDSLRRELTESRSRLAALNTELGNARQQADPDYQRMEQQIREQVAREYRQQNPEPRRSTGPTLSRAQLIDELSSMDPMEMGQLMTLQGRYGAFLQSLNVDDQRKEVIIDALSNYLSEQNDARREVMIQARADGIDRRQIRDQMRDINSPELRRDSLSYALSEDELAALEQFELSQLQSGISFSTRALSIGDGSQSAGGVFYFDGNDSAIVPGQDSLLIREVIRVPDQ